MSLRPVKRGAVAAAALLWRAALLCGTSLLSSTSVLLSVPATAHAEHLDGRALFLSHCGVCHLAGGTGTFMLGRRLGKARALLTERRDLTPALIDTVVRNGLESMPALTRVEITDAELAAVANYLARAPGAGEASRRP